MTGHYYLNPEVSLAKVGKVAVIELENYSRHPQVSADFTESLSQGLAVRTLFGLKVIYRTDAIYNSLQLDSDGVYTLAQLSSIREALKTDAILTGSITQYQPYPHMSVGIRLRLLDLRTGQLLWALQQVWDGSDKVVAARMKGYFKTQMRKGYEPLKWELAVVSPRHFRKFVIYEIVQTLPK
jgi:TolB-like protein